MAYAGQHDRHFPGATRYLRLCFRQRGDIRHDADVAAIRQRCGTHVQGHPVRPPPFAHLRPGDIEGHLLRDYLIDSPWAVFARAGTLADHVFETIPDIERRPLHHLRVCPVEHCHPMVRAIDADAMWKRLQDGLQQRRPPVGLLLGRWQRFGSGHGPGTTGQPIRVGGGVIAAASPGPPAYCAAARPRRSTPARRPPGASQPGRSAQQIQV